MIMWKYLWSYIKSKSRSKVHSKKAFPIYEDIPIGFSFALNNSILIVYHYTSGFATTHLVVFLFIIVGGTWGEEDINHATR